LGAVGEVALVLQSYGPWGLLAFVGWYAYAKDRQLRDLYGQVIQMVQNQTTASVKLEAALNGLSKVIEASSTPKG